jgi:hypothetical protein
MNREEYLAWAKRRAIEYLEIGELPNAVASMVSDLQQAPKELDFGSNNTIATLGAVGVAILLQSGNASAEIRRWVEGFH